MMYKIYWFVLLLGRMLQKSNVGGGGGGVQHICVQTKKNSGLS